MYVDYEDNIVSIVDEAVSRGDLSMQDEQEILKTMSEIGLEAAFTMLIDRIC